MRWLLGACLGVCIVAGSLSQAVRARDGQAPDGKTGAQSRGPVDAAKTGKVPEVSVKLGPLNAQETGRIFGEAGPRWLSWAGRIYYGGSDRDSGGNDRLGGGPKFADLTFRTDENGHFAVDGVRAGLVTVEFTYAAFDVMRRRDRRCVQVLQGEATEVRFSDTNGEWDLPLEIVIGDGSARQFDYATRSLTRYTFRHDSFSVRLESKPGQRVSYPAEPTASLPGVQDRRVVIRDVSPGKYRLAVYAPRAGGDLDMGRIPAYEGDIVVKPNGPPVRVELGAGAILGQMPPGGVYYDKGKVFVVPEAGGPPIRDRMHYVAESFEVRFVPPGKYSVVAWHEKQPWFSKLDGVVVNADTPTQARMPRWVAGGTITGRVRLKNAPPPTAVTATDSRGVTVQAPKVLRDAGEEFTIGGLWPGPWTLKLRAGEEVLATAQVAMHGGETAQVDLVGK